MSVLLLECVAVTVGEGGAGPAHSGAWEVGKGVLGHGTVATTGATALDSEGSNVPSWACKAAAAPGSSSTCHRFLRHELKWFLMALSERPGKVLAICDHLGPMRRNIWVGGVLGYDARGHLLAAPARCGGFRHL